MCRSWILFVLLCHQRGLPFVPKGKSDYAIAPLLEFFAKARCPHILEPTGVATVEVES